MGGPRKGLGLYRGGVILAALLSGVACAPRASKPPASPPSLPPQTLSQLEPEASPPSTQPVAVPAPDPTVVVVEPGGDESVSGNLVAAARAEKERRRAAGPPVAVLDDKNIREFAKDQKLTFATPEKAPSEIAPAGDSRSIGGAANDSETYWRQRGRRLRERWKTAAEEIGDLRERAAGLRNRFYSTDDQYIRDAEIKPAWDRTLDRIESTEREIGEIKQALVKFQEEGQRSGAYAAWLLDGVELEPRAETEESSRDEPGEPKILDEKPH